MGSRNVLTTSGFLVFFSVKSVGFFYSLEVDAVVQERFKKMIRFKRVPGLDNMDTLWLCQNSYRKWWFIVDLP